MLRLKYAFAIAGLVFFAGSAAAAPSAGKDTCVECHQNTDFMVTNKKLYDYFQRWQASAHGQEDVTCVDCHRGNSKAAAKDAAHSGMIAATGTIGFKQIPKVCGECHENLYKAYITSKHYKHLEKKREEDQGPQCVTCHGSVSAKALDVNTVKSTCENCHNKEKDIRPEVPQKAEVLLNDLNSIRAFTRFISIRGSAEDVAYGKKVLQPKIDDLATTWHTFDLKKIEPATKLLYDQAKGKRNELKSRKGGNKDADAKKP